MGPEITNYKDLAAYFRFDFGFGNTAFDSNFDQIEASLQNREDWTLENMGKLFSLWKTWIIFHSCCRFIGKYPW